jgi:hypothetical protein
MLPSLTTPPHHHTTRVRWLGNVLMPDWCANLVMMYWWLCRWLDWRLRKNSNALTLCWCIGVLSVDVLRLMCRWLCWCVNDCVDVLMCLGWCVDVLMTVLTCWCVDDCVLTCWCVGDCVDVLSVDDCVDDCVDVLMCWWLRVDVLMCW